MASSVSKVVPKASGGPAVRNAANVTPVAVRAIPRMAPANVQLATRATSARTNAPRAHGATTVANAAGHARMGAFARHCEEGN